VLAIAARFIAIVAVVAVFAVPASARSTGVGFTFVPKKVVQGEDGHVSVRVRPSGSTCTLIVRYQGGTTQPGLGAAVATGGRVGWTWKVPTDVQAGPATATVRCARAGAISHSLIIVGRLIEPKIDVVKMGFTTRPNSFGSGTKLSYGVILHNEATDRDALDINVQVNFVMADNNLLGTDTEHLDGIPAGGDYALGHMVTFPAAAPITRLEVVIQVAKHAAASQHNPTLANMHLVPQLFDPSWLGTIEGEIQNTDPLLILQSANLSAVVFDSAGNVLGGGSGFAFQALPPGARQFIQLSNGFDAIPTDKAASAMVSVTSNWKQPGSS
jgi:hypothetical protein